MAAAEISMGAYQNAFIKNRRHSHVKGMTRQEGLKLVKLAVANLIGPLIRDRKWVCPINFQVSLHFLLGGYLR